MGPKSEQAGEQAGEQVSEQAVRLDKEKIDSLMSFCNEARTTKELMEFLEIQSRQYFLNNILKPLIAEGKIVRTIPDKPSSPKQKYIKKT